jgi:hypothetical protein
MKTKASLLLLACAAFLLPSAGAQTFTGNLTLSTQSAVDASAYSEVTGNLSIDDYGDPVDPITNVDGFASLTSVGNTLFITSNQVLTDLDGLASLTSIGSTLLIGNNAVLTDLDGLSWLTSVGGFLFIGDNPALDQFCGLYTLLDSGGLTPSWYFVSANLANPTIQEVLDAGPCFIDTDGDGIPDDEDACPESILSETVIIGEFDSEVENVLFEDGCTIADLLQAISDGAANHGEFVSGASQLMQDLVREGVLTGREKGAIVRSAAKSGGSSPPRRGR